MIGIVTSGKKSFDICGVEELGRFREKTFDGIISRSIVTYISCALNRVEVYSRLYSNVSVSKVINDISF